MISQPEYLPVSKKEAETLGIDQFDIILISGDAYVDHPSFSTALIGRVLWDAGFTVGIIPQPDIKKKEALRKLGKPKLFFSVSGGNLDSMVANLTPNLKRRGKDAYSPGGRLLRPDRAALVYTDKVHAEYPDVPIVLGGIEASLRRFAHYDYWSDSVRNSLLADAPADLLVYGMGEHQITEIALKLRSGSISDLTNVKGTVWKKRPKEWRACPVEGAVEIPNSELVKSDKKAYAQAFAAHYTEQNPYTGRPVVQVHPKTVIIQNPPAFPLKTEELDRIYELPYSRRAHPSYTEPVPALESVRFSVTSHRGCFGACSFCALAHHQGGIIQSRSPESIKREITRITKMSEFKGTIQDIGGPTANMYMSNCKKWERFGVCSDKNCTTCPSLENGQQKYLSLLEMAKEVPGVKHVFIGSGIRYDLLLDDDDFLIKICNFVSGHLKVAPEHISEQVTSCMNKPGVKVFEDFRKRFEKIQQGRKKRQYIVPYLMSSHPACSISDMIELAEYIKDNQLYTEQVQDFTPTPMTISTCMYFTRLDPFTLKTVHIPRGTEKKQQRALLHYRNPDNHGLVLEALRKSGREDLIGSSHNCLIADKKRNQTEKTGIPRRKRN